MCPLSENVVSTEGDGMESDKEIVVPRLMLAVTSNAIPDSSYAPFLNSKIVELVSSKYQVKMLRDTGCSMLMWVKPSYEDVHADEYVLLKGVTCSMAVPNVRFNVVCLRAQQN